MHILFASARPRKGGKKEVKAQDEDEVSPTELEVSDAEEEEGSEKIYENEESSENEEKGSEKEEEGSEMKEVSEKEEEGSENEEEGSKDSKDEEQDEEPNEGEDSNQESMEEGVQEEKTGIEDQEVGEEEEHVEQDEEVEMKPPLSETPIHPDEMETLEMPSQAGTWDIDPCEDSQVLRFTPANPKDDDSTGQVPELAAKTAGKKRKTKADVADSEPKLRRTRETVLQRQKSAVERDETAAGPNNEVGKEEETDRTKTSSKKRSNAKKEETQQQKTTERSRGSKEAKEIQDQELQTQRNEETDVKFVEDLISDEEGKDAESRGTFKDFGVDWVDLMMWSFHSCICTVHVGIAIFMVFGILKYVDLVCPFFRGNV